MKCHNTLMAAEDNDSKTSRRILNTHAHKSASTASRPAGGGVVSMVRLPLGGADRCGCGGSGPLHQPQGLEGVVVEALLRQEALRRVEQQQVLQRERE